MMKSLLHTMNAIFLCTSFMQATIDDFVNNPPATPHQLAAMMVAVKGKDEFLIQQKLDSVVGPSMLRVLKVTEHQEAQSSGFFGGDEKKIENVFALIRDNMNGKLHLAIHSFDDTSQVVGGHNTGGMDNVIRTLLSESGGVGSSITSVTGAQRAGLIAAHLKGKLQGICNDAKIVTFNAVQDNVHGPRMFEEFAINSERSDELHLASGDIKGSSSYVYPADNYHWIDSRNGTGSQELDSFVDKLKHKSWAQVKQLK